MGTFFSSLISRLLIPTLLQIGGKQQLKWCQNTRNVSSMLKAFTSCGIYRKEPTDFFNEGSTSLDLANEDIEQRQCASGRCNGSLTVLVLWLYQSFGFVALRGKKIIHYFSPLMQGRVTPIFFQKH